MRYSENGYAVVKRSDLQNIQLTCEIDSLHRNLDSLHRNLDSPTLTPGANLLVCIKERKAFAVAVLSLNNEKIDILAKEVVAWRNCTELPAFIIEKYTPIAFSFSACNNHNNCKILGLHVADVGSFFPDQSINDYSCDINSAPEDITEIVHKHTAQDYSMQGFKGVGKFRPCVSIFLHSIQGSEPVRPVSTMIKVKWTFSDEDVKRKIDENDNTEVDFCSKCYGGTN